MTLHSYNMHGTAFMSGIHCILQNEIKIVIYNCRSCLQDNSSTCDREKAPYFDIMAEFNESSYQQIRLVMKYSVQMYVQLL